MRLVVAVALVAWVVLVMVVMGTHAESMNISAVDVAITMAKATITMM